MQTKIIIIASEFIHKYVEKLIEKIQVDCDIKIIKYKNFDHLVEIYKEYEDIADGFMISGQTALSAIEKEINHRKKPIVPFQANITDFYRLLVDLFINKQGLNPQRVILDFLIPTREDSSVAHMVSDFEFSGINAEITNWTNASINFSSIEETIVHKATELWEKKAIDLVICAYGSVIPLLEAKGIPCCYNYPSKELLLEQIQQLLSQIELEHMYDNLPAVISITDLNSSKDMESREKFKAALLDVKKNLLLDVITQEEFDRYYLFTSAKVISIITENMTTCCFRTELKDKYNISAAVGYGIGFDITIAKSNSEDALKESLFSGSSYIVDEYSHLLGPLDSGKYLEVPQDVSEQISQIAESCKLSTLTIQKIMSITKLTGSSQITTQTLATHMDVTIRNAQRILTNLEKGGAATLAYTHSTNSKGRPVKVYELNF